MTKPVRPGPDARPRPVRPAPADVEQEEAMPERPTFHPTRRSFLAASGLGAASLLLPSRWAPADAAGDPWARADTIAAGITVPTSPARDFDITRHGAAPDATAAIARAVAACSAAGGGRVL